MMKTYDAIRLNANMVTEAIEESFDELDKHLKELGLKTFGDDRAAILAEAMAVYVVACNPDLLQEEDES